jgi:hypothetical protein
LTSSGQGPSQAGTHVRLTVPQGATENAETIRAVVETDEGNINRQLIDKGYGRFRKDLGGAEQQAMFGRLARTLGKYAEEVSFEGDNAAINPMRYIPTPFHTKMWQERTAYSQYLQQEAIGTRMRRWERPIHDFLAPYFRGLIERTTDTPVISAEVEHRRDLDTLTDMLAYLRSLKMAGEELEHQVPPRPQHIYARARTRRLSRFAMHLVLQMRFHPPAACLIGRPR